MERRKIIKIFEGQYQLLKPTDTNLHGWYKYGKNKNLKAISDLLKSERFALDLSEEVVYDVSQYRKRQEERRKGYFSNKGLESKTI
jgi:hypothetical protein